MIVDLSRGSEIVLQTCSERVVRHILQRASERFRDGKPSRPMQIFIEEAHRLLHRDQVKGFETLICSGFSSGAYRDRTGDLRLANPTDCPTAPDADQQNRDD